MALSAVHTRSFPARRRCAGRRQTDLPYAVAPLHTAGLSVAFFGKLRASSRRRDLR